MNAFVVTGTDTDIGKTVCAAILTLALDGLYWKPLQSGTEDGTDTKTVQQLTGLSDDRFLPERYVFSQPLSPHRAAELDGVDVDTKTLSLPDTDRPLIIEGAGGLLVPVTRDLLLIDLFQKWSVPLVLCARTALGTINHTLLSVEAVRRRNIPLHGIVFIGDDNPDNMQTIAAFSGAAVLGHIPHLDKMDADRLQNIFTENFTASSWI